MVVTMSPWGNYTFRVIARNKIGLSLPSMQTFNICSTQPDVPDKNPENVIGEGDQPNNLVIFWTVRTKKKSDCIVLYCIVFIHFYSASHSLSLSEALPTTAIATVSEFTRRSEDFVVVKRL